MDPRPKSGSETVPIRHPRTPSSWLFRDGKARQLWTVPVGQEGQEKPGECNWVHAVAVDSQGNLYAGDINGKRLQKFIRR